MFESPEVLASPPGLSQPYTLILVFLNVGDASHRALVKGHTGSLSGTPMRGVGPKYSELGKIPSSGAGSARRGGCVAFVCWAELCA
jgi:hypothetical protein